MNDDVQIQFGCKFEMLLQEITLPLVIALLVPARRRWMIVIESSFTDSSYPGMPGKFAKFREVFIRGFMDITGVNAHTGQYLGKAFGQFKIPGNVGQIGCEGDQAIHSGFPGPVEKGWNFLGRKLMRCKVAMAVGEHQNLETGATGLFLQDGFSPVETGVGNEDDGSYEHQDGEEPVVGSAFQSFTTTSERGS